MFIMFHNKCPVCGTEGKVWRKKPEIFVCPHCLTIYSHYGIVLEAEHEIDVWS